ncbi:MAG: PilZ domain-containing protein, partial [Myxococcota bacterium]
KKPTRKPQVRVPVRLLVVTPDGADRAVTKNISIGGLYLITKKRFTVGAELPLVLEVGEMRLEVTARVTHQQADGAGFSFVDPSPLVQEIVREQIDSILSQETMSDDDTNPRVVVQHSVSWSIDGTDREEAEVRDLSLTGAYLATETKVEVDDTIYIYVPGFVATDGGKASEVRGVEARVVHTTENGFGVRFLGASAEFRMAIERMVMILPSSASDA